MFPIIFAALYIMITVSSLDWPPVHYVEKCDEDVEEGLIHVKEFVTKYTADMPDDEKIDVTTCKLSAQGNYVCQCPAESVVSNGKGFATIVCQNAPVGIAQEYAFTDEKWVGFKCVAPPTTGCSSGVDGANKIAVDTYTFPITPDGLLVNWTNTEEDRRYGGTPIQCSALSSADTHPIGKIKLACNLTDIALYGRTVSAWMPFYGNSIFSGCKMAENAPVCQVVRLREHSSELLYHVALPNVDKVEVWKNSIKLACLNKTTSENSTEAPSITMPCFKADSEYEGKWNFSEAMNCPKLVPHCDLEKLTDAEVVHSDYGTLPLDGNTTASTQSATLTCMNNYGVDGDKENDQITVKCVFNTNESTEVVWVSSSVCKALPMTTTTGAAATGTTVAGGGNGTQMGNGTETTTDTTDSGSSATPLIVVAVVLLLLLLVAVAVGFLFRHKLKALLSKRPVEPTETTASVAAVVPDNNNNDNHDEAADDAQEDGNQSPNPVTSAIESVSTCDRRNAEYYAAQALLGGDGRQQAADASVKVEVNQGGTDRTQSSSKSTTAKQSRMTTSGAGGAQAEAK